MDKKQPSCWKCAFSMIEPNADGQGYNLKGCKEDEKIHSSRDAEEMCPLFLKDKVIITINSGCAEMVSKPDDVEVEIRDYDVQNIDAEDDDRCKQDGDGDWYQEMLFPAAETEEEETEKEGYIDPRYLDDNVDQ